MKTGHSFSPEMSSRERTTTTVKKEVALTSYCFGKIIVEKDSRSVLRMWSLPKVLDLVEDRVHLRSLTVLLFVTIFALAYAVLFTSLYDEPLYDDRDVASITYYGINDFIMSKPVASKANPMTILGQGISGLTAANFNVTVSIKPMFLYFIGANFNCSSYPPHSSIYQLMGLLCAVKLTGNLTETASDQGIVEFNHIGVIGGSPGDVMLKFQTSSTLQSHSNATVDINARVTSEVDQIGINPKNPPVSVTIDTAMPVVKAQVMDGVGYPIANTEVVAFTLPLSGSEEFGLLKNNIQMTNSNGIATFDNMYFVSATNRRQVVWFQCLGKVVPWQTADVGSIDVSTNVASLVMVNHLKYNETVSVVEGVRFKITMKVLDLNGIGISGRRAYCYVKPAEYSIGKELLFTRLPFTSKSDSNGILELVTHFSLWGDAGKYKAHCVCDGVESDTIIAYNVLTSITQFTGAVNCPQMQSIENQTLCVESLTKTSEYGYNFVVSGPNGGVPGKRLMVSSAEAYLDYQSGISDIRGNVRLSLFKVTGFTQPYVHRHTVIHLSVTVDGISQGLTIAVYVSDKRDAYKGYVSRAEMSPRYMEYSIPHTPIVMNMTFYNVNGTASSQNPSVNYNDYQASFCKADTVPNVDPYATASMDANFDAGLRSNVIYNLAERIEDTNFAQSGNPVSGNFFSWYETAWENVWIEYDFKRVGNHFETTDSVSYVEGMPGIFCLQVYYRYSIPVPTSYLLMRATEKPARAQIVGASVDGSPVSVEGSHPIVVNANEETRITVTTLATDADGDSMAIPSMFPFPPVEGVYAFPAGKYYWLPLQLSGNTVTAISISGPNGEVAYKNGAVLVKNMTMIDQFTPTSKYHAYIQSNRANIPSPFTITRITAASSNTTDFLIKCAVKKAPGNFIMAFQLGSLRTKPIIINIAPPVVSSLEIVKAPVVGPDPSLSFTQLPVVRCLDNLGNPVPNATVSVRIRQGQSGLLMSVINPQYFIPVVAVSEYSDVNGTVNFKKSPFGLRLRGSVNDLYTLDFFVNRVDSHGNVIDVLKQSFISVAGDVPYIITIASSGSGQTYYGSVGSYVNVGLRIVVKGIDAYPTDLDMPLEVELAPISESSNLTTSGLVSKFATLELNTNSRCYGSYYPPQFTCPAQVHGGEWSSKVNGFFITSGNNGRYYIRIKSPMIADMTTILFGTTDVEIEIISKVETIRFEGQKIVHTNINQNISVQVYVTGKEGTPMARKLVTLIAYPMVNSTSMNPQLDYIKTTTDNGGRSQIGATFIAGTTGPYVIKVQCEGVTSSDSVVVYLTNPISSLQINGDPFLDRPVVPVHLVPYCIARNLDPNNALSGMFNTSITIKATSVPSRMVPGCVTTTGTTCVLETANLTQISTDQYKVACAFWMTNADNKATNVSLIINGVAVKINREVIASDPRQTDPNAKSDVNLFVWVIAIGFLPLFIANNAKWRPVLVILCIGALGAGIGFFVHLFTVQRPAALCMTLIEYIEANQVATVMRILAIFSMTSVFLLLSYLLFIELMGTINRNYSNQPQDLIHRLTTIQPKLRQATQERPQSPVNESGFVVAYFEEIWADWKKRYQQFWHPKPGPHSPFEMPKDHFFPLRLIVATAVSGMLVVLVLLSAIVSLMWISRKLDTVESKLVIFQLGIDELVKSSTNQLIDATTGLETTVGGIASQSMFGSSIADSISAVTDSVPKEISSQHIVSLLNLISPFQSEESDPFDKSLSIIALSSQNISQFVDTLRDNLIVSAVLGSIIAILIVSFQFWFIYRNYRRNIMRLRLGNYTWIDKAVLARCTPTMASSFIGLQAGHALVSYFLNYFLISFIIFLIIWTPVRTLLFNQLYAYVLAGGSASLIVGIASKVAKKSGLMKAAKRLGKSMDIYHRRWLSVYEFVTIILGILSGLMKALIRLLRMIFQFFLGLTRLDRRPEGDHPEKNLGYMSYMSMLLVDHHFNNPIVLMVSYLMMNTHKQARRALLVDKKVKRRFRHDSMASVSELIEMDDMRKKPESMLVSILKAKDGMSRVRAKTRWFLAYTLLNNRSLIKMRKQFMATERESIRLEEEAKQDDHHHQEPEDGESSDISPDASPNTLSTSPVTPIAVTVEQTQRDPAPIRAIDIHPHLRNKPRPKSFAGGPAFRPSKPLPQLPRRGTAFTTISEWTELWSDEYKRKYYFNRKTGQSSWQEPQV